MSDVVLGKLTAESQGRDAIHVAVIPMKASETLKPGQRVARLGEGLAGPGDVIVGIVDPFLTEDVPAGEVFWLCLLPNTVTGMRHHWNHPSFSTRDSSSSEEWLRDYAARVNTYDSPGDAFERLIDCLKAGDLFFHGSDLHGLYELDDAEELRRHAEAYLGIRIEWGNFTFSCSC